jgi:hypothetical protein
VNNHMNFLFLKVIVAQLGEKKVQGQSKVSLSQNQNGPQSPLTYFRSH